MNKSKKLRRMSVVVSAALLTTLSLVSITLAKYQTVIEATGTATVATWKFTANNQAETLTFALPSGTLAPGSTGSYDIVLLNESSVAAEYSVELNEAETEKPEAMELTLANATGDLAATNGTATAVLNFNWDFSANDADDMENWSNGETITVSLTITGTQKAAA